MIETSNYFVDPNRQFSRSDSFSTIDSSLAADDLRRQYADMSKPTPRQPAMTATPVIAATSPPNMKFEKSENINVTYNNYYNNLLPEQKPSRNNSLTSFLSEFGKYKKNFNFSKFLRTKKGTWTVCVIIAIILSVIASVICSFVFLDKSPSTPDFLFILDETTTIETTTTEAKTIDTTTPDEISSSISTTPYSTTPTTSKPTTITTPIITSSSTEDLVSDTTDLTSEITTSETTTTQSKDETKTIEEITTPEDTTTTTKDTTTTTEDITTTITTSRTTTTTSTTPKPTTTEPNLYPDFYMTRDDWEAESPRSKNISKLQTPIKKIIIGHTGGRFCVNVTDCINAVKSIQTEDFSLEDIPYNFLIGVDGKVYEGRGFGYQGQHTKNIAATDYNSIGIMIAFIGNYKSTYPSVDQIILLKQFIEFFQKSGNISNQYLVFSQDDLMYQEVTAESLNGAVSNLQNYHSLYKVHRRKEWGALIPKTLPKFNRVMNWIIIGHITNQGCSDKAACIKEVKKVETENLKANYSDIVYNFLVGGKGLIFEGRGWDIIGQTTLLPTSAISVMVLGDYRYFAPPAEVERSLKQIFDDGLTLGKLTNDYKVFGRSDFGQPGPGALLMNQIKKWDRYGNKTTY